MLHLRVFVIGLVLLATGCATTEQNRGRDAWPSPGSYGGEAYIQQQAQLKRGEQQYQFIAVTEINAKQVRLVGLSIMGVKLFDLSWDGTVLTSHSLLPKSEQGPNDALVLESLLLALWPPTELDALLSSAKLTMITTSDSRVVSKGDGQQQLTVLYQQPRQNGGQIRIIDKRFQTELTLTTIEWQQ
ncbi:DUF3261 domain-containing protein [Paraferrimonas haliotis]|uniref:DUF3261 domain-containing protein n=1 Tax=Paraferrimonas haliotis TaxID=2013866 RepID=A0AA37WX65_9GAMM|nr:DUF3261 domain-containing protein [Paraferrimonas haliotis]GLS83164.1 hypothetical protein GCM10007894_11410 [Paraferrimonas haliotis]